MKYNAIKEKHVTFLCAHCREERTGELKDDFTTLELVRIRRIKCDICHKVTNEETKVSNYETP